MDKGRRGKLNRMKAKIKIRREKGDIYCDKCECLVSHRTVMKILNKKFCPTCYIILEIILDKFVLGTLKR